MARLSRTGPQLSPRRAAERGASDRRATLPEACGYRRGQVLSESVHTFDAAADQLESSIRSAQQSRRAPMSVQQTILDELNSLMAKHPMRTRLKAKGKSCLTELWFEPREPEDLFAPLAHGAAILFADLHRKRVRKCARCVLHFYDTSKKGTRRWCSMQVCGNRLKVAAYAARQRQRTHK